MAVVAIQGYDTKQNKAVYTAACLAGMIAMQSKQKTLILQFIDSKDVGAEVFLNGVSHSNEDGLLTSATGMDTLLEASSNGNEITSDDFSEKCDAILNSKNKLDVASVTRVNSFLLQLVERKEEISNLFDNANDVYDNIIEVLPTLNDDNKDIVEFLNGFADVSIYCRRQGNHRKLPVYGKKIVYLFTSFDSSSKFGLRDAKREITTGLGERVLKIEANSGAIDASQEGRLIYFIKENREASGNDVNTEWVRDLKDVIDEVFEGKVPDKEPEWEKVNYVAGKEYENMKKGIEESDESHKKSGGLFSGLFGKKKSVQPAPASNEQPTHPDSVEQWGEKIMTEEDPGMIDDTSETDAPKIRPISDIKPLSPADIGQGGIRPLSEAVDNETDQNEYAPLPQGVKPLTSLSGTADNGIRPLSSIKSLSSVPVYGEDTEDTPIEDAAEPEENAPAGKYEDTVYENEGTNDTGYATAHAEQSDSESEQQKTEEVTNDNISRIASNVEKAKERVKKAKEREMKANVRFQKAQTELKAAEENVHVSAQLRVAEELNLEKETDRLENEIALEKEKRKKEAAKNRLAELNNNAGIMQNSALATQKEAQTKLKEYAAALQQYASARTTADEFRTDNEALIGADGMQGVGNGLSAEEASNLAQTLMSIAEKVETSDFEPSKDIEVSDGQLQETEDDVSDAGEKESVSDMENSDVDASEGTEAEAKPFITPEHYDSKGSEPAS